MTDGVDVALLVLRAALDRKGRCWLLVRRDWTVSGRAWTTNRSPLRPSLAHSTSIGRS